MAVNLFSPSQPPFGDDIKEKDFDLLLQSTWPFGETVHAVDELETQVMNFEGETQVLFDEGLETQVMNFEGKTQVRFEDGLETQVTNFAGETQVLDDFLGFDNMDTQLLDERNNKERDKTDGEESNRTDMLCDTDEFLDNDSVKVVNYLPGCENTSLSKQDDKANKAELDALFYEQTSAGAKMNFASVRATALRAFGLAARSKAIKKSNSDLCSSKTKDEALKDHTTENNNATGSRESPLHAVEITGVLEVEHLKVTSDESKGRIESSAARRHFIDDGKFDENEGLEDNKLNDADEVGFLRCNEVARLSYVDSEEPGDLSQANALDFVDKFLKSNDTYIDKGVSIVGSSAKKSMPDSNIKGTQSLAKKSRLKSLSGEMETFNWDDNREDEGGGEFFSRNKKVFFDYDEKDLSRSLHTSNRTAKKAKIADVKKNLLKELDEQLNLDTLEGQKATCSEKDLQDKFNVGPNTQMAVEAMEELYLGLEVWDKDTDKITETTSKSSSVVDKEDKILFPTKFCLQKRSNSSSCEDRTKKSNQRQKSVTNLSKESTVSPANKSGWDKQKDLDKCIVPPSSGQAQVPTRTSIASQARPHCVTRQWIAGNIACDSSTGTLRYKKGKRNNHKLSDNGHGPVGQVSGPETKEKANEISNGSKTNPQRILVDDGSPRKTCSSLRSSTTLHSSDRELLKSLCDQNGMKENLEECTLKRKLRDGNEAHAEISGGNLNLDVSPGHRSKFSVSTFTGTTLHSSDRELLKSLCNRNGMKENLEDCTLNGKLRDGIEACTDFCGGNLNLDMSPGHISKLSVSTSTGTTLHSSDRELLKSLCNRNGVKENLEECTLKGKLRDGIEAHADISGGNLNIDVSPGYRSKLSVSTSTGTTLHSSDRELLKSLCNRNGMKENLEECNLKGKLRDGIESHADFSGGNLNIDVSPGHRSKLSVSTPTGTALHSSDRELLKSLCDRYGVQENFEECTLKGKLRDEIETHAEFSGGNLNLDVSLGHRSKLSVSTSTGTTLHSSDRELLKSLCNRNGVKRKFRRVYSKR